MRKGNKFWGKLRLAVIYAWRPAIIVGLLSALLYFLLWFKLGTLTGGLSATEATAQQHLALRDISLRSILNNPLYLPYSLILYGLQALGLHGPTALRGVSAVIASVSAISFYLLIRRWHTPRMAIFGTLLFTTSSWFLHLGRYADTDILYIGVITLLLTGVWLQQSKYRRFMLAFVLLATALYMYVPGMIWLIVLTGFWQSKRLMKEMKRTRNWYNALIALAGLVLLSPLIASIVRDPSLIKPLLGLPTVLPSIGQLAQNLIDIPTHIFVRGPATPEKWLPGTPYLDIFSGMMLIIGIYWSIYRIGLDRIRATYGVLIVGVLLVTLGGPVSIAVLLPGLYLLITAGMTFMLQQWFTVFPRNPIARSIGTILLSLSVLVTVFYHINHYFIAWPNTPAVRQSFTRQPLIR